ncbi:hypothetical protein QAD02_009677 [Eretmocerus hayati]|uniref:Uncharacterized protein n=1 Tax=Eretmocerus hayati TaxID=131215 RepID=A0ACC2NCF7_9HYME|nr:hypothetical protein QAD02_009677 [Eretmocerus hayati]
MKRSIHEDYCLPDSAHQATSGHVTGTSSDPCGACTCSSYGITQEKNCIFDQLVELQQGPTESEAEMELEYSNESPWTPLKSIRISSLHDQQVHMMQRANLILEGSLGVEPRICTSQVSNHYEIPSRSTRIALGDIPGPSSRSESNLDPREVQRIIDEIVGSHCDTQASNRGRREPA